MRSAQIDLKDRKRAAPWKKPRRVKKPKVDRKAQRQATAAIQAALLALQAVWLAYWNPPQTYKSKADERRRRSWFVRYQQRDGLWAYAAKGLVDRALLMAPRNLTKLLSLVDLPILDPELYFGHGYGQVLHLDKATPLPMPPFNKRPPGFAKLLAQQKTALLEAGYVPPETVKPAPAKTAIIPFKKDS